MKKFISFVLVFMMLLSSAAFVSADTAKDVSDVFTDVSATHWAKSELNYFYNHGIIDGYGDGSFRPSGIVTREEFCKLLVTTFNYTPKAPQSQSFDDVKPNRWSYAYIDACKSFLTAYNNPFGGLPSFRPGEAATREDIAVALVLMMGYSEKDAKDTNYALNTFTDGSKIAPALLPYVSVACEKGLINGYPDGTFGPLKGISRAETIVLLNRATKQAGADIFPNTEAPTKPEAPINPEKPTDPEKPVNPEKPVTPEKPVGPEKPAEPEKPVTPSLKEDVIYGVINGVGDANNSDGDRVQYIIGFADGKAIDTITNKNTSFKVTTFKTGLAEITINSDGLVTAVTYKLSKDVTVQDFDGNVVETVRTAAKEIVVNGGTYKIADDAVIYVWDVADNEWSVKSNISAIKKGYNIIAYTTDDDIEGFNIVLTWE